MEKKCQCGEWSGHACPASLDEGAVTIDVAPLWKRESHAEAHCRGNYPDNGDTRLTVTPSCAEIMRDCDPDWTSIV